MKAYHSEYSGLDWLECRHGFAIYCKAQGVTVKKFYVRRNDNCDLDGKLCDFIRVALKRTNKPAGIIYSRCEINHSVEKVLASKAAK